MSDNYTFDISNFADNSAEIESLKKELAVAHKKIDELRKQKTKIWMDCWNQKHSISKLKDKILTVSSSRVGAARTLIKLNVKNETISEMLHLSIETVQVEKSRLKNVK